MSNAGNFGILLCHTFCGINHQKNDIGPLNGSYRTDNTVTFKIFFNFILSADSGRINKYIFLAMVLNDSINGISGRTGNVGYDGALRTAQFIYE